MTITVLRKFSGGLTAAVLLYLGLRAALLFSSFDRICLPGYELHPMGNLAKDVLEGGGYPILGYCDTHSGGELLTGFCAVPFYLLLGDSYLSLKLVPLAAGLFTLLMLHVFLKRYFSRNAAVIGSHLFALGPYVMVNHSLMAMGNHFEILFFLLPVFLLYYGFHWGGSRPSLLPFIGFAAGLAFFHNFSSAIPLLLLGLCHAGFRGLKRSMKDLVLVLPGFALGVLPLVLINLGTRGGGAEFIGAKFLKEETFSLARFLDRLGEFFLVHLPQSSCYPEAGLIPAALPRFLMLLCFLAACAFSLPLLIKGLSALYRGALGPGVPLASGSEKDGSLRESLGLLPFLLYLPCFALAYAAGTFQIGGYVEQHEAGGYRYCLTFYLMAIVLLAITASRLLRGGRRALSKTAGWVLAAVPILCGITGFGAVDFTFRNAALGLQYPGYFSPRYSRGLFRESYRRDPALILEDLAGMRPCHRHQTLSGVGYLRALIELRTPRKTARGGGAAPLPALERKMRIRNLDPPDLLRGLPVDYHIDLAWGVGGRLRECLLDPELSGSGLEQAIKNRLAARSDPCNAYVYQGLMLPQDFVLSAYTEGTLYTNLTFIHRFPEEVQEHLQCGNGIFCGRILRRRIASEKDALVKVITAVPPSKHAFFFGLGFGLADGGEEPDFRGALEAMDTLVPGTMHGTLLLGFGAGWRHIHGPQDAPEKEALFEGAVPPEVLDRLLEGLRWPDYPSPDFF